MEADTFCQKSEVAIGVSQTSNDQNSGRRKPFQLKNTNHAEKKTAVKVFILNCLLLSRVNCEGSVWSFVQGDWLDHSHMLLMDNALRDQPGLNWKPLKRLYYTVLVEIISSLPPP